VSDSVHMQRRIHSRHVLGLMGLLGWLAACGAYGERAPAPRDLGGDLVLGPQWTELEANPPLVVQRTVDELVLHHSTELTLTRAPRGAPYTVFCPILGEMIRLDVELVGTDGSIEALAAGGISPGRLGMRPHEERVLAELEVSRVRLRANRPLEVSRLEWRARGEGSGSYR
jgi:hypothetical protein